MSLPMSRARSALLVVASASLLAGFAAVSPGASAAAPDRDTVPHWFGVRPTSGGVYTTNGAPSGKAKPGGGSNTSNNGIFFHGGPVMTSTAGTNAYYIWYGSWSGNTASTILENLATSIAPSNYFNINTTYYDASGVKVTNKVTFAGSTTDTTNDPQPLSDSQIGTIVARAINGGKLPADSNGVYFVLTAGNVQKSGFGTNYCGWHTHGTIAGKDIKYSFVGNPQPSYPSSCAVQTTSPNGNWGADAMASVIAHELEEAVTDPDLNAWYDRRGYENADKCAWTFGTTSTASNGSKYNVTLGGKQYLIQRNWVNAGGGYCSMSY